ncbi:MAG: hypothetical protein ACTSXQ_05195 [Alphaproteobacteria bacterium]
MDQFDHREYFFVAFYEMFVRKIVFPLYDSGGRNELDLALDAATTLTSILWKDELETVSLGNVLEKKKLNYADLSTLGDVELSKKDNFVETLLMTKELFYTNDLKEYSMDPFKALEIISKNFKINILEKEMKKALLAIQNNERFSAPAIKEDYDNVYGLFIGMQEKGQDFSDEFMSAKRLFSRNKVNR